MTKRYREEMATEIAGFQNYLIRDLQVGLYELPDEHVYIISISPEVPAHFGEERLDIEWVYCDEHGNFKGSTARGYYHVDDSFLYGRPMPYVIEELPV